MCYYKVPLININFAYDFPVIMHLSCIMAAFCKNENPGGGNSCFWENRILVSINIVGRLKVYMLTCIEMHVSGGFTRFVDYAVAETGKSCFRQENFLSAFSEGSQLHFSIRGDPFCSCDF